MRVTRRSVIAGSLAAAASDHLDADRSERRLAIVDVEILFESAPRQIEIFRRDDGVVQRVALKQRRIVAQQLVHALDLAGRQLDLLDADRGAKRLRKLRKYTIGRLFGFGATKSAFFVAKPGCQIG